ncbi:hypothetical protein [Pseudomonas syringae]|uniref:hypothetical protein n=1 Tax=Pseudomonas syringae TaxID=317 RepID=UPI000CDA889D|nr:hypothetical protein [Pseudomonas syringae]POR65461.1 hypothetical protein BKM27_26110 [Pseudomonas syringae pv. syringae]POR73717.1 hypothetical protein BKM30_26175 [Pseudomonas syringae pv. syringae]
MSNRELGYLVVAIFVLLAVFHPQLIGWIDVDGFWFLVFFVAVIAGRLSLYGYRKSLGRKDSLDTRRWWDIF